MDNEPALCPKCNRYNLVKEVTYSQQVTVGYCVDKKCGYTVDKINRVETPHRVVAPYRDEDKEWWYEQSAINIHKLSQRGK